MELAIAMVNNVWWTNPLIYLSIMPSASLKWATETMTRPLLELESPISTTMKFHISKQRFIEHNWIINSFVDNIKDPNAPQ